MSASIAAAKGIDPCPMCGSDQVRWQNRRWYDVVRTWIRFAAESIIHPLLGGQTSRASIPGAVGEPSTDLPDMRTDRAIRNHSLELNYAVTREVYEAHVAGETARAFWRCKTCGRKGEQFANAAQLLALRETVVKIEDQISGEMGVAHNPVDRDGLGRGSG